MNDATRERLAVQTENLDNLDAVKYQLRSSGVVSPDSVRPVNMDALIKRFERLHYSPHDDFLQECRDVWAEMDISDAPDGDDIKTAAAVDTFARLFVQRYETTIPQMCPHTEQPASNTAGVLSSIRERIGL